MRHAGPGAVLTLALLAAGWCTAAMAEDSSTLPGAERRGAQMQRPMQENPEMRPFIAAAPASKSVPAAVPARTAPAVPQPAVPAPQAAALRDIDRLLRRAEADITARRMREADTDLAQPQAALLNARPAGDPVPEQAVGPLAEAWKGVRKGDLRAAARATELAERAIAAAQ